MDSQIQSHSESSARSVTAPRSSPLFPRGYAFAWVVVVMLFFLWGMSNNLTDILVQQFKKSFELSSFQAQLVQTAVFLGYFFMALPMAALMRSLGYKVGMLAGLVLFGIGTLLFWPAAHFDRYNWMLTALFFVGCGSAGLEAAANPFVAEAGPPETAERRLNLAQAFNPAGSISGILVGTFVIFSGVELAPPKMAAMRAAGTYAGYLHGELMRVVPTYLALGAVVLLLALTLAVVKLPQATTHDEAGDAAEPMWATVTGLLRLGQVRAAVLAQFCYCGAQIATWSAFIPYVRQYTAMSERTAGLLLTVNLIALTCGRFFSSALMRWIRPSRMMLAYALVNTALIVVAVLHPGAIGLAALIATSFFMSIMYPTIFALGIKGLGARTKVGGSLIVMSVGGGGIVPPALGLIARHFVSYASGYSVITVCYLVVAIFAWRSEPRQPTERVATIL